jgi:hypothetical protein
MISRAAKLPDPDYPSWRWDQGRLEYFRIEIIPKYCQVLCRISGLDAQVDDPQIRFDFKSTTGFEFKPGTYTLWRNYGRVFKLLLIAQSVDGRISATSLARAIGSAGTGQLDSDAYLEQIFALTQFPNPAFEDYSSTGPIVRPMLAVLRTLLLHPKFERGITAEEVGAYLIANRCSGTEPASELAKLVPGQEAPAETLRQIREMLRFMAQHSALAWIDKRLAVADPESISRVVDSILATSLPERKTDRFQQISDLAQTAAALLDSFSEHTIPESGPLGSRGGLTFAEGDRRLVQHTRIERNRLLRQHVLDAAQAAAGSGAVACDCCGLVPATQYPWADSKLLEVHHLLPLASPARANAQGTEFESVVLVCPNCHKAVHARYRIYLAAEGFSDFASESQASSLYAAIREETRLRAR